MRCFILLLITGYPEAVPPRYPTPRGFHSVYLRTDNPTSMGLIHRQPPPQVGGNESTDSNLKMMINSIL